MLQVTQDELDVMTSHAQFSDQVVTVDISEYTGAFFDWSASRDIEYVYVRSASGGVLYGYDQDETSGDGLGNATEIANISFCYVSLTVVANPTPSDDPGDDPNAPPPPPMPDTAIVDGLRSGAADISLQVSLLIGSVGAFVLLFVMRRRLTGSTPQRAKVEKRGPWSTNGPNH